MHTQDLSVGPGDLIIAPPRMQDPRFNGTVLMITHENNAGTFALCLNKPTDNTVNDIADEVGTSIYPDQVMHWGGPVNPQTVWMLHSAEWSLPQTMPINDQWSMTSNRLMFHEMAQGNYPERYRITFGFACWAKGQLESELAGVPPHKHSSSWLIWRNPQADRILEVEAEDLLRVSTEQCAHQTVSSWLT